MKTTRMLLVLIVSLVPILAYTQHDHHAAAPAKPASVVLDESAIQWGPAPPVLPKGAQAAILYGDPTKPGPFVVRLKFPAGYKVGPHWHPTDENVTVLSGTVTIGMGDAVDESKMKVMPAGSYWFMPAEMRHYAWTKDGATIQLHGVGPFAINYVNAADDPSKAK